MPGHMKKAKPSNTAKDLNRVAAVHNIDNSSHTIVTWCMI